MDDFQPRSPIRRPKARAVARARRLPRVDGLELALIALATWLAAVVAALGT